MNREKLHSIISQASELARLLLRSPQPPRKLTADYLHGRKRASSTEKGLISSLAHHAILHWRHAAYTVFERTADVHPRNDAVNADLIVPAALLLTMDQEAANDRGSSILAAFLEAGSTPDDLREAACRRLRDNEGPELHELRARSTALAHEAETSFRSAAIFASLPDWAVGHWRAAELFPAPRDIRVIGHALARPAPLTLRANTLICTQEHLLHQLRREGHACDAHPLLPDGVVVHERVTLTDSPLYSEGCFEVQDAGSQLIGLACGADLKMRVFDACAGAGGKTMHLANLMRDTGVLTGSDIERNKVRGMQQRGERLGLTSLSTVTVTPAGTVVAQHGLLPDAGNQDVVLVDAPCSGFGTVRRSPTIKWKLTERTVSKLAVKQLEILERNATYVSSGGILIYATCSLLPQENQDVVTAFLQGNPDFEPEALAPVFKRQGVELPGLADEQAQLMLHPSTLDSDGYFMARLRRRS